MKKINILTLILSTGIVACGYVHIYYSHKLSKLDGLDQLAIALSIHFLIQLWFSGNYLFIFLMLMLLA